MDVFDLYAKISLDTSSYDKGMADAKESAESLTGELNGNLFNGLNVAGDGFDDAGHQAGIFGDLLKKRSQKQANGIYIFQTVV